MTAIDYFAWLVFLVIILSAVYVVVALAQLPGKTARKRGHPQADAINVAGWVGIFTGVAWVVAIIWAFMKPIARPYQDPAAEEETAALKARVAELEAQLAESAGVAPVTATPHLSPSGGTTEGAG